jgi:transketolase
MMSKIDVREAARKIRNLTIKIAEKSGTGHIASGLSMADILACLYFSEMRFGDGNAEADHFVLSKGHGAISLYATLSLKGFIDFDVVTEYHRLGSTMTSFPSEPFYRGLDFASGSLGHGASVSCGLALAAKLDSSNKRVYCIVSDGECQEGAIWEAALFAGHHQLDNLTVVVDYNKLQALGKVGDIVTLEPFADKWRSFGWDTIPVDGHDVAALTNAFEKTSNKPKCIIADTIKGKGVSFMEGDLNWHYLPLKGEYLGKALLETSL